MICANRLSINWTLLCCTRVCMNCFSKYFIFQQNISYKLSLQTYFTWIRTVPDVNACVLVCVLVSMCLSMCLIRAIYIMDGIAYYSCDCWNRFELNRVWDSIYTPGNTYTSHIHLMIIQNTHHRIQNIHASFVLFLALFYLWWDFRFWYIWTVFVFAFLCFIRMDLYDHKHKLENSHPHHKACFHHFIQSQLIAHTFSSLCTYCTYTLYIHIYKYRFLEV